MEYFSVKLDHVYHARCAVLRSMTLQDLQCLLVWPSWTWVICSLFFSQTLTVWNLTLSGNRGNQQIFCFTLQVESVGRAWTRRVAASKCYQNIRQGSSVANKPALARPGVPRTWIPGTYFSYASLAAACTALLAKVRLLPPKKRKVALITLF